MWGENPWQGNDEKMRDGSKIMFTLKGQKTTYETTYEYRDPEEAGDHALDLQPPAVVKK